MNSKSPCTFAGTCTGVASAILLALGAAAGPALADQPALPTAASRAAEVSLADLDLSTAEGMRQARERLHAMAEYVCRGSAHAIGPNLTTCVDSTLASHLKQIDALKQIDMTTRNSVTRAANVSLADLNLSTPEGSRIAHERLESMARRLCKELARSHELTYQPNYAACVHDTLAGAWAQANVIRAANDARTAHRTAP